MSDEINWPPMPEIPKDLHDAIHIPHKHEHPIHNKPVWLIWKTEKNQRTGVPYFPEIDTVCDGVESAEYHVRMLLLDTPNCTITIERVPCNHRFGSSMQIQMMDSHYAIWKARIAQVGKEVQERLNAGASDMRQTIDAQLVTWGGKAAVYELIRERQPNRGGAGQITKHWLRHPNGDEKLIPNDMAQYIRERWALGQTVDLDRT